MEQIWIWRQGEEAESLVRMLLGPGKATEGLDQWSGMLEKRAIAEKREGSYVQLFSGGSFSLSCSKHWLS